MIFNFFFSFSMKDYNKNKDPIYRKINDNSGYVIFYSEWCGWSMKAVSLLEKAGVKCKGYIIDKIKGEIKGDLSLLLERLKLNSEELKFDNKHKTRPLIFKDGQFIGGHDALVQHLKNKKLI